MKLEKAKEILKKYGQEHLLLSYERLDEEGKEKLLKQIEHIDFEQCNELFELTKKKKEFKDITLEPLKVTDASKITDEDIKKITFKGEKIIKEGKLAVVMMAGGQGTRLGHSGPKGTYDFGLKSHKTIFEVLTDKFKEARDRLGVVVPWYIMTSRDNNEATVKFFEENHYFGYREGIKTFFNQNELPMLDEQGKLILDEDGLVKEAANGHGGVYEALVKNGILEEMQKNGVEWIFICGVDNVLVKVVDPVLIGYSALNDYKITSVSCVKSEPQEKVGVLCKKNGKPSVVEYTEMTDELKEAVNDEGELMYGEGHVLMNLFHISVISDIAKDSLEYHVAHKKCDYMNEKGEIVKATEPNAYKFEAFLFDAFERLDEIGVLRYHREECFAPIKNATGNDSPETAKALYEEYYHLV